MKTLFLSSVITICLPFIAYCQKWKEGLSQDIEIGINYSYFTYNLDGLDKRYSAEFRIGSNIEKSLGKRFGLRLGLRLGFKPKMNYRIPTTAQPPQSYLTAIDEPFGTRHHYFLEMPAVLVFHEKNFLGGVGVLARHYIRLGESPSPHNIGGRYETGFYSTIGYKPIPEIRVAVEAYFGLTSIVGAYFADPNNRTGTLFEVRSNFIGLSLAYQLR